MKFVFSSKDICNSTIRSAGEKPVIHFTVSTDEVDGKKRTLIWNGERQSIASMIHWKDRLFEIQGRKLSFTTVKVHPPGFWVSDTSRIWRWSGDAYLVEYDDQWEVKSELEKTPAATMTPYRSRFFHDDETATIAVEPHAEHETLFFIMLFVYSEYKRLTEEKEDEKTRKQNAKNIKKFIESQSDSE